MKDKKKKCRLISHGTISLKLLYPNEQLNLTRKKRLDSKYSESYYHSFNISGNHFSVSKSYTHRNKISGWKYLNKDIKRIFPYTNELRRKELVSTMQVWIYDEKWERLKRDLLLTSRKYTRHHCEKHNIDLPKDKWGYVDFENHFEMLLMFEKLKPKADVIIFGRDIKNYFNSIDDIREYYGIPDDDIIIIYNTLLETKRKDDDKYNSNKSKKFDDKLDMLCRFCIDNNIKEYIVD